MILDLPKVGPVSFSDDLTDEELSNQLNTLAKKYDFEVPKAELGYGEAIKKGFTRGAKELGSAVADVIPAMGAKALGFNDYAQKQMQEARDTQQEIAKYYAPQYQSYKDVKGIGDVPKFMAENFAEQIPNLLTALIPGVGAEAVATRLTAGTIAKDLMATAAKEGLTGDAARAFVEMGLKDAAPQMQIAKSGAMAQHAGLFLGNYAQTAPSAFQDIYEKTGELAPGASMIAGGVNAALGSVVPASVLGKMSGPMRMGVVENLLAKSGMEPGLARAVTANALQEMGVGAVTGGAQPAINTAAANFVANKQQIFDSQDWHNIIDATIKNGMMGALMGGAGGAGEAAKAGALRKAEYDQAMAQRQGRLSDRAARDQAAAQAEAAKRQDLIDQNSARLQQLFEEEHPQAEETPPQVIKKEVVKPQEATLSPEEQEANELAGMRSQDVQAAPKPIVTDKMLADMGIGHTALIRRNKILEGKDLSDPVDLALVKQVLDAYLEKQPSERIANKVNDFLQRDEFKALEKPIEESVPGPVTGAGESSISDTEPSGAGEISGHTEGTPELVGRRLGETESTAGSTEAGEEPEHAPLGKKEVSDVAKAEAAVEPAVKDQLNFVDENNQRTNDLLNGQVRDEVNAEAVKQGDTKAAQAEYAGRLNNLIPSEDHTGTEAHSVLSLPPLFNEFFRLQDVAQKATEPKQRAKNIREMQTIREAIAKAHPDGESVLEHLKNQSPEARDAFMSNLNKHARDVFEPIAKQKVAEAKERLEKNNVVEAKTDAFEADVDKVFEGFNKAKLSDTVKDAIPKGFTDFVEALAKEHDDPDTKAILNKIKKLKVKTKIVVGKVEGKGKLNQYDFGSYDPATNTITLDPKYGLNSHTAVHEVIHAAISHVLRDPNHPLTKDFTTFFEHTFNRLGDAYGARDLQEFAAELVSNPEFQALLKDIKAPKSGNLFSRIMQSIAEFFGFKKGTSAYEKGLDLISKAIDVSGDAEALPGDKLFYGSGDPSILREVGEHMPVLAKRAVESTKNGLSNLKDGGWMRTASGLLRLDNLITLYNKELPSLKVLADNLERRTGRQELGVKEVNDTYNRFLKTQKKFPEQVKRLNEISYDASARELDLADKNFIPEPKDKADYDRLKRQYDALPSDVKQIYTDARAFYDKSIDGYQNFLLANTPASLHARIKNEFELEKRKKGYIPFLRRGDYWVEYNDPATNQRAASSFESVRQRDQFLNEVLKPQNIDYTTRQNLQDAKFSPSQVPPHTFIGQVIRDMRASGSSDELVNNVYQSYLSLFPAQSIVKQFMKRKNVPGMEKDMIRAFGDVGIKWTRRLADAEFSPNIDKAVDQVIAEAQNGNRPELYAVAQNIANQRDFYHNPTFNKWTQAATTASYFEYLAGNISSALVNLTNLPILVWPTLGGEHGFANTSSAMMAASKVAMNDWSKHARYGALHQTLMDHAQLQHTMAREVLEGRRTSTEDFTGLKARVMDAISIPFAASERYNRAVTAIAAYDLAKGKGMAEQHAIDYALTKVKDLNTSGLASTAPTWMQNPVGRIFFTFKSYAWNSAFVIARAFHQAFKGESPEVKAMARKQLLGIYGMSMAFAGVQGLPFFGATSTLANMIQALAGDDDQPYDLKDELRQATGELAYKGPVNYLTNLELANRSAVAQDLLFRDDPRGVAEHGYVLSAMQQAFGPAGSYAVNVGNAFNLMNEGHTERAIENMLPAFVRNGMKGFRYMTEGAQTLKGDPIQEDVSAWNSAMQVLGFSPADISSNYEKSAAATAFQKDVLARRQKLLNRYDMARTAGDSDLMSETKDQIKSFNDAHPQEKIDGAALTKSEASRRTAEKNMINGVTYNKKLRGEIQEKFFN